MDKKIKKKLDRLQQHQQALKQRLAGAKRQDDEPGEVQRLEKEIAETQTQIDKLKSG